MEYLQWLQDEVLEEEAALLEEVKDPRLWGPSTRRSPLEMRRGNGPPRSLEESNRRSTMGIPQ